MLQHVLTRYSKLFIQEPFYRVAIGYNYAVDFVADKSKKDSQGYKEFLEGCGYKVFYKNINVSYSIGKVRFRPWAEGSGKMATNATTFNKELLIVEKENDGKPFELHTTEIEVM